MNNVQVFTNQLFGSVRSLEINDEPWFVGVDIAKCLGYSNPWDALSKHVDERNKGVSVLPTPGGPQKLVIINESGLYSLVMKSRMPLAKEINFKKWVTETVVPNTRKIYTDNPLNVVDDAYNSNNL